VVEVQVQERRGEERRGEERRGEERAIRCASYRESDTQTSECTGTDSTDQLLIHCSRSAAQSGTKSSGS